MSYVHEPAPVATRASGTLFQPSLTRYTMVYLSFVGVVEEAFTGSIVVAGVTIMKFGAPKVAATIITIPVSFIVPTGDEWEWVKATGTPVASESKELLPPYQ